MNYFQFDAFFVLAATEGLAVEVTFAGYIEAGKQSDIHRQTLTQSNSETERHKLWERSKCQTDISRDVSQTSHSALHTAV